jgi:hypothetical protein
MLDGYSSLSLSPVLAFSSVRQPELLRATQTNIQNAIDTQTVMWDILLGLGMAN